MKLRAIELANIRRFAGRRARLGGIGDGITVLAEPNEFGKSTLFDALHATFFERHASRNATVRALRPHAGGAPEAAVEIELPEGRFRIAKRWLDRPLAQVADAAGRLIAQADEAEAWIDGLTGGGLAGPSGLLWVRQGLMALDPEARAERAQALATRRDLLSSIAGEIDLMTGGRRMDAVLARLDEALARLATPTGRPKAGGDWARALDEGAALSAEEAALRPRATRLTDDLARRAEVGRRLARLADPAEAAARVQALAEAQAAHQAALAHQDQIAQAETALRLARLDADRLRADIAAAAALAARVTQARAALARADEAAAAARIRADDLGLRDRAAAAAAEAQAARVRDLRDRLQTATRARAARQARTQAKELRRRLDRAAAVQGGLQAARAQRAGLSVTARLLDAAEAAHAALDLARARAEAQAVTVEAHPLGAPARMNGAPLPAGPVPILGPAEIDLPGFGRLRLDPGAGRQGDTVAQAERALARLLAEARLDSLAAARAQWAEAQRLDSEAREAEARLAEIAPDGLDPLRLALARATAEGQTGAEGATGAEGETGAEGQTGAEGATGADAAGADDDPAPLAAALAVAETDEHTARAAARTAQALSVEAGNTRAGAEATRATAARHLALALAEAGDEAALAARLADLGTREPALGAAAEAADRRCAALRAAAPDPVTATARLARATGAAEQARATEQAAREDLASLNATIAALADEGIEEQLSALAEARDEALARARRYEAEVRALTRLRRALDEARRAARDAYFGPVLRELHPLLAILHPGARLGIDDATLLPATLDRNGQTETLEILSGGTREQVAILTRLAFARLFAAAGRPVPVILDDALVHSDDERIEAMFDALHRTARDQQILILTCRQRAFATLGGDRARVVVSDA
jgi:DNA repair exonuclease SbcCD ATPase subunit